VAHHRQEFGVRPIRFFRGSPRAIRFRSEPRKLLDLSEQLLADAISLGEGILPRWPPRARLEHLPDITRNTACEGA
jgi:hypothetical protein